MTTSLGSMLLGSADPLRLRRWYQEAFNAFTDADGFMHFGSVAVLIDSRDDVAALAAEPGRMILNFHVDDAEAAAGVLDRMGATWLSPLETRDDGWFATLLDPDGNIVQIIELSEDYLDRQRQQRRTWDG